MTTPSAEPHAPYDFPRSRLSVSLRVRGDDLDPAEITRTFGVEPDFSARKGESWLRRGRTVIQASGIWTRRVRHGAAPVWDLERAVHTLLADLPTDLEIWRALGSRYTLDIFCGLFMSNENQGTQLSAATLLVLGERGLVLDIDVYGPPPIESAT